MDFPGRFVELCLVVEGGGEGGGGGAGPGNTDGSSCG